MQGGSSELLLGAQEELRRRRLLELARPRAAPPRRTWRQRAWFYTTSSLAMCATAAGASLLFLVPLYVDPAISTLAADFSPEPVRCVTSRRSDLSGIFNCTWSSCREGCTSDMYRCTHVFVSYNATEDDSAGEEEEQAEREAVLLVNIKGCGYPPLVDCRNFSEAYGRPGAVFPCHYSRQNRSVAMAHYRRDEHVAAITHFFGVPFVLTVATSVALCVLRCDCRCSERRPARRRRARRAAIEDASEASVSTRVDMLAADVTRPL